MVVGGSWGATLALAYAQAHPDRVSGIVLRATFLGTAQELDGAFLDVLPRHYPGLYEDFLGVLPAAERADPLPNYYRRILDPDPAIHAPAARAWYGTESILSEHTPARTRLDLPSLTQSTRPLPSTPFMEAFYFQHDCFMRPGQLLELDCLERLGSITAPHPLRLNESRPLTEWRLRASAGAHDQRDIRREATTLFQPLSSLFGLPDHAVGQ
eukprot:gene8750-11838_t